MFGKKKQKLHNERKLQITTSTLASFMNYLTDKRFDRFTKSNLKDVRRHPSVRAAAKILSYATVREGTFRNEKYPERAKLIETLFKLGEESYKSYLSRILTEGMFWGWCAGEIIFDTVLVGGVEYPYIRKIVIPDQTTLNLNLDKYGELQEDAVIQYKYSENIRVPKENVVVYYYGWEDGRPDGGGELEMVYPLWYIWSNIEYFYASYLEKKATPPTIGKTSEMNRDNMYDMLDTLNTRSTLVISHDDNITQLQPAKVGNEYINALEYFDKMIFRQFLVPSTIMDVTKAGSYALGKEHKGVVRWRVDKLAQDMEQVMNYLIRRVSDAIWEVNDVYTTFQFEPFSDKNMKELAEIVKILRDTGYIDEKDADWVREGFNVPKRKEEAPAPEPEPEPEQKAVEFVCGNCGYNLDGEDICPHCGSSSKVRKDCVQSIVVENCGKEKAEDVLKLMGYDGFIVREVGKNSIARFFSPTNKRIVERGIGDGIKVRVVEGGYNKVIGKSEKNFTGEGDFTFTCIKNYGYFEPVKEGQELLIALKPGAEDLEAKYLKEYERMRREVIKKLKKGEKPFVEIHKRMGDSVNKAMTEGYMAGCEDLNNKYNLNLVWNLTDREAIKLLSEMTILEMKDLDNDLNKAIRLSIAEGTKLKETIDQLAMRVSNDFDMAKWRARMIARTEVNRAYNHANLNRLIRAGYERGVFQIGSSEKSCDLCISLNGKTIYLKEVDPWSTELKLVGNNGMASMPPIHPNCGCTVIVLTGDRALQKILADEGFTDQERLWFSKMLTESPNLISWTKTTGRECGLLVDKNGIKIVRGGENSVTLFNENPGKSLSYHTHPDGLGFSGSDIGLFLSVDSNIEVVDTPQGLMYVVTKTKNTQSISFSYINELSVKMEDEMRAMYRKLLKEGWNKGKAAYKVVLDINLKYAKKYKYNFYVFDRNKGIIRKWIYGN